MCCFVTITFLMQYLALKVLSSDRVSAQSLGLSCITCAIDINPTIFLSLEHVLPFIQAQDPKLRSSVSKVCTYIVAITALDIV